jgi:hypothetical protein
MVPITDRQRDDRDYRKARLSRQRSAGVTDVAGN